MPDKNNFSGPRRFIGRPATPCRKCVLSGKHGRLHYVCSAGGVCCRTCQPPRSDSDVLASLVLVGGTWDDADDPFDPESVAKALTISQTPSTPSTTNKAASATSRRGAGWPDDIFSPSYEYPRQSLDDIPWESLFGKKNVAAIADAEKKKNSELDSEFVFSFSVDLGSLILPPVGSRVSSVGVLPTFSSDIPGSSEGAVVQSGHDHFGRVLCSVRFDSGRLVCGIARGRLDWLSVPL